MTNMNLEFHHVIMASNTAASRPNNSNKSSAVTGLAVLGAKVP